MKPLLVYLDSSDYSNFARKAAVGSAISEHRKKLLDWTEKGTIEIRYSYAHVMEAAPVEQMWLEPARERMKQIESMCRRRCFAEPQFIFARERDSLRNGATINSSIERNDGRWHPDIIGDALDFPTASDALREKILTGSRRERRAREARYFDRDGRIRPAVAGELVAHLPEIWKKMADKYPFSDSAYESFKKYFLGESPKETVIAALNESLADLESFSDWHETHWNTVSPLSAALRKGGQNIADTLRRIATQVDALYEKQIAQGFTPEQIQKYKERGFEQAMDAFPNTVAQNILQLNEAEKSEISLDPDVCPATFTLVKTLVQVIRLTSYVAGSKGRSPKPSDALDLMHAAYLPFVDFFRADGFMANAIRDANLPFKTKVVQNLDQLIRSIEQRVERNT